MHHHTFLISELAVLGLSARSRVDFRRAVLARIAPVLTHTVAVFHSAAPVPPGIEPVIVGLSPQAERRLRARWATQARDLEDQRGPVQSLDGLVAAALLARLTGELQASHSALLLRLERASKTRAWLLLARRSPEFSTEEIELAQLLAPVVSLADANSLELPEAVGSPLSAREVEIFEYLCRGFRNEDIAEALGTSRHTVRNQLVRLYRKVGVCTRSELVGLASTVVRRSTQ
jgi:DNA-binding NarL/FixJ family response regulator